MDNAGFSKRQSSMGTRRWPVVLLAAIVVLGSCRSSDVSSPNGDAPADDPRQPLPLEEPPPTPAPWQQATLSPDDVPPVYVREWREAENRASCALIAPDALGRGEEASPRSAQFAGGWAVAYDMPELRSAFGVAGTGTEYDESTYDEWPFSRRWADGSSAGYGPEGGSGPNQLAYLRIAGQDCLYNVWSRLGVDHLEYLLEHLRFVETP